MLSPSPVALVVVSVAGFILSLGLTLGELTLIFIWTSSHCITITSSRIVPSSEIYTNTRIYPYANDPLPVDR